MSTLRPGHTEITYPKNVYQFFTYIYGNRVAMVWVDKGKIISKGFTHLPEWQIHKKIRRSASKKGGNFTAGHNIQSLKLRLDASNKGK
jgi:hypothetical protein